MTRVVVVVHDPELLAAPDVRPTRYASPSEYCLANRPAGDTMGREERDRDFLGAQVRGVPRPRDLDGKKNPPRHLRLKPKYIDLHVTNLIEADSLCHPGSRARARPNDDPRVGYSKIGQEGTNPKPLRRYADKGVQL